MESRSASASDSPNHIGPFIGCAFQKLQYILPYLVGDYEQVSNELAKYMRAGFDHFILDILQKNPICDKPRLHSFGCRQAGHQREPVHSGI